MGRTWTVAGATVDGLARFELVCLAAGREASLALAPELARRGTRYGSTRLGQGSWKGLLDAYATTAIGLGLGWSPFMLLGVALAIVVGYLVYGQLGRTAEARTAVENLLRLFPGYGAREWEELGKWFLAPDMLEHLVDGLRKAGLSIPQD